MTVYNVSTTAALRTALGQAQAGDSILLASGTYSGLSVSGINPSGNVTITSQNPAAPAVLTPFTVSNSSNLTFSHLEMNASGVTGGAYAFQVSSSSKVTFDSNFVHGPLGVDPNQAATGLLLKNSSNVSVTNSTFQYLQSGMMDTGNNGVLLSGNSFSHMAGDGIDNAGVSNVQVLNNSFTDTVALTNGLHPDAIQFWTAGTTTAMQNITISGNTFVRGSGIGSQGVFIEDDNNLPYQNVSVTNNTIIGGQYNGISVYGAADNFNVSDNQIVSYSDYQSFLLVKNLTGGTINNNRANLYELSNNTNVTQSGDVVNAMVTPGGAPTIANTATAASYQAGGAAAGIGHFLVLDSNVPTLASATVAITGGFLAGDALNFTNQARITGSYNSATGVLTLSGTASQAAYQAALDSVTFSSSASDPTHAGADTARTIGFSVNDGSQSSSAAAATVSVGGSKSAPAPAPPSLSNTGAAVTYVPGGAAADIAHSLGVTDPSSTTLASAKVSITGGFLAGDALKFTNQNGITGSYNASTGVLTLTGTASLANYQTALDSITYSSSVSDPTKAGTDLARTVSFIASDGSQSSSALAATVNVSRPAAPSLTNSGAAVTYVAGGAAADIAHSLGVTDVESTTLASAKVSITGGFLAGDALHFTNQSGITGSYNASTGVLTLTGSASLAAYQTALDSITYSSSATDPTKAGTDTARTISFSANDGSQTSNTLAAALHVASTATSTPPTLANAGAAVTYAPGGAAADIAHALTVADLESTTLASAKVSITGGFLAGDALKFTNQNGISGSYNASTGVLTLTGSASLAAYQTALDSITYSSSASDPTHAGTDNARTVSFSVNDGSQSSSALAATVNVSRPAPPTLSNSGATVTYVAGGAAADIAHSLIVTDAESTTLASARVSVTGGFLAGDALHFANQNGITGSYNASTGVLTLTGAASLANYKTALDSITYSSSASDPTHAGTDNARTVSFSVNDGSQSSSALAATVNVAPRQAPKLTNTGTAVTYVTGGTAVDIAHALAVADASSTTLASARVAIASGLRWGDALHFTNQNGITGSYNSSTGVLTLTGTASLAAYQTALDSITYSSSSHNPTHSGTDNARTISFMVNDGARGSNTLAATVDLSSTSATTTATISMTTASVTTAASATTTTSTSSQTQPVSTTAVSPISTWHADAFIVGASTSTALSTSTHLASSHVGTASSFDFASLFGASGAASGTIGSHPLNSVPTFDVAHLAAAMPLLGGHDVLHQHVSLV